MGFFYAYFYQMKSSEVYTIKEATAKLMRYCAYQERSHYEVEQRLKKYKLTAVERQEVISNLIKDNFLNEERFALAFATDKFRLQKWGRIRISRELKSKQVSEYLINKALNTIDQNLYLTHFEELFEKRLNSIKESDPFKRKRKIADYLFRRGYESELIYERLQDLD